MQLQIDDSMQLQIFWGLKCGYVCNQSRFGMTQQLKQLEFKPVLSIVKRVIQLSDRTADLFNAWRMNYLAYATLFC